MTRFRGSMAIAVVAALAAVLGAASNHPARAAPLTSSTVVISQIYGGGGNTGAPLTNDYIEIFNRSLLLVDLTGWSLQYTSATGTGNFGSSSTLITPLSGLLAPGQYMLVEEGAGAGSGVPLPSPRLVDPTPIAMSATGGKVALVNTTPPLGCNGGSTPCPPAALAQIVDLIGYDAANFFEGASPAPTLSNTTAAFRAASGCQDTDNNGADFTAAAPAPRTQVTPVNICAGDLAPTVTFTFPANGATNVALASNLIVTFSETVNVTGDWFTISCGSSGAHTAAVTLGPVSFNLNPDTDFAGGETCTVTVLASQVTDQDTNDPPDNMEADFGFSFTTTAAGPPTRIHDIQGASHISPKLGMVVSNVEGVVTAKRSNGFYMEDLSPDANDATSEGIFVFTSSAPSVNVGDSVAVNGRVAEFRPGGSSSTNLTTTELTSPSVTVLSSGNPLPAAVVIGTGGRVPPSTVIEDDAIGDVETSGVFDPASDGIDFYESLEGMLVQVNDAVAVGPTNAFGEIPVVGDDGANASVRTARGGVVIRPSDFNPERIILDNEILATPTVNVGDHFSGPAVGVLDYSFGNFKLQVTTPLTTISGGLARETAALAGTNVVSIATFNVENLDPSDPASKFAALASLIVNNLRSPDILSLEEVQDNNGPTNDSVVAADVTLDTLIAAIQSAGGPTYDFRQIDPADDQDGGEPGGNIRVAFLFRTDRGLSFVDAPGGDSTTPTAVTGSGSSTHLSLSPGRVDPANPAWSTPDPTRKPLAGEFLFDGHKLFVVANHWKSKGGDQPLFGHFQPPALVTETQRAAQAQVVNDFVDAILAADPNANVVVLGDLNDFEFSSALATLKGSPAVLRDLVETLPEAERYSYVFEGNSQALDHILLSSGPFDNRPFSYDVVHVNSEFTDQASDHDPSVVRITLNDPPSADAGGPYSVDEGSSVAVSATGNDPEGAPLGFAWDLDDDGSFETAGQTATFSAAALDGPATRTIHARATDDGGLSATGDATVTIENVAPSATFDAPASSFAGFAFALSLTDPSDPSSADAAAGFTYAFDCGDGSGYGAFGASASDSCGTTDVGTRSVGGKIRDKDGGVHEYRATVDVIVTFDSLCELTRSYATDPKVADTLCDKLQAAATAPTQEARNNHLGAYRNQVDAKTGPEPGKAFTAEQAAVLKQLALRLEG